MHLRRICAPSRRDFLLAFALAAGAEKEWSHRHFQLFMTIDQIIRAVQKELGVGIDGRAGPETWKAIYTRVLGRQPPGETPPDRPPSSADAVDPRSERVIATLQPQVRPYARALVKKAASMGITIKVISGLRTYAEQNELYAQGRTKPGRIVTNARGGYSNHNFGIAFDIGVFDGSRYIPESPRYKAVGALGVELGLEWGGNWRTIQDEPHFQLRPQWARNMTEREMLAELRSRTSSGRGYYV
jgi:peptidoglycan L-alanyl-D-glutamate endopeptidase CwlK